MSDLTPEEQKQWYDELEPEERKQMTILIRDMMKESRKKKSVQIEALSDSISIIYPIQQYVALDTKVYYSKKELGEKLVRELERGDPDRLFMGFVSEFYERNVTDIDRERYRIAKVEDCRLNPPCVRYKDMYGQTGAGSYEYWKIHHYHGVRTLKKEYV